MDRRSRPTTRRVQLAETKRARPVSATAKRFGRPKGRLPVDEGPDRKYSQDTPNRISIRSVNATARLDGHNEGAVDG